MKTEEHETSRAQFAQVMHERFTKSFLSGGGGSGQRQHQQEQDVSSLTKDNRLKVLVWQNKSITSYHATAHYVSLKYLIQNVIDFRTVHCLYDWKEDWHRCMALFPNVYRYQLPGFNPGFRFSIPSNPTRDTTNATTSVGLDSLCVQTITLPLNDLQKPIAEEKKMTVHSVSPVQPLCNWTELEKSALEILARMYQPSQ